MSEDERERRAIRLPTRVPGLDTVMEGGLFVGAVYMVMGNPGAGKTILGNQICFEHVRRGTRRSTSPCSPKRMRGSSPACGI